MMLLQVSKPYTGFFSDESIKSMTVKEQSMPECTEGAMDVDNNAPNIYSNMGDAEQGHAAEENDYGDGDGDGDGDDGGYGED